LLISDAQFFFNCFQVFSTPCWARWVIRRPLFSRRRRRRRDAQTVRTCRSRPADAAAAPADDAAATLHQKKVASREADAARNRRLRAAASVDRMQLMPLPRLQTTRRPRFTRRRRWQVVRLMLRAGVSRVQRMPLPRSNVCGEVCVCRCRGCR